MGVFTPDRRISPVDFSRHDFGGEISGCLGLFALSSVPVGDRGFGLLCFSRAFHPLLTTQEAIAAVVCLQANHEGAGHFDLSTCTLTIFWTIFAYFLGESNIIILRPSFLGACCTSATSSRSAAMRLSNSSARSVC